MRYEPRLLTLLVAFVAALWPIADAVETNGAAPHHREHEPHHYKPALSVTIVLVASSALSVCCGLFILYTFLKYKVLRRYVALALSLPCRETQSSSAPF